MDGHLPTHYHYKSNHFVPNKGVSDSLLAFDFVLKESLCDSNRVKCLKGHLRHQAVDKGPREKKQASQFLNQHSQTCMCLRTTLGRREQGGVLSIQILWPHPPRCIPRHHKGQ